MHLVAFPEAPTLVLLDTKLDHPPPLQITGDLLLFLDFDGTLVEIAEAPDRIAVSSGLPSLLDDVSRALDGGLVIVTGRRLDDVDRHLGRRVQFAAGVHGGEIRGATAPADEPEVTRALARARRRIIEAAQGLLVEEKGLSIALHYRSTPERFDEARALAHAVVDESEGRLCVQPGRMVFEVKPSSFHKGQAVRRFLKEPKFAGRRAIFVGDDVTDEDGFAAVTQSGGYGILVGEPRNTFARFRIGSVDGVHQWLRSAVRR